MGIVTVMGGAPRNCGSSTRVAGRGCACAHPRSAPGRAQASIRRPMPNPGAMRLSVVVVTHESAGAVAAALSPLAAQLGPDDELIVVDNASTDETLAVVERVAPGA